MTDSGILREICQENGLDPGTHEAAVRQRFGQLIEAHLAEQGTCRPIPGGPTLFEALRKRRESLGWTFVGVGGGVRRVRGQCQHWMPDLSMLERIDAVLGGP